MFNKTVLKVCAIIVAIAGLQFIGTILIGRSLTREDFGLYRLILSFVDVGSMVAVLGADFALVRFFSSSSVPRAEYDWRSFTSRFQALPIAVGIAAAILGAHFYHLNRIQAASITIMIAAMAPIFLCAALVRSYHHYSRAILLNRLPFPLFFAAVVLFYASGKLTFASVLCSYVASILLACAAAVLYCISSIPSGPRAIPPAVLRNSGYYFGIGVSLMVILQSAHLFIGKMLSLADLAVYGIILSIMRLFEFAQDSAYYVLAPALNRSTHLSLRRTFAQLMGLAAVLAVFYSFFAGRLIHALFAGKYDEGLFLVPYFILVGIIRTAYVIPASIIGGKSSEAALKLQFHVIAAAACIHPFILFFCIRSWNLRGAALAQLITWTILLAASLLALRAEASNHSLKP